MNLDEFLRGQNPANDTRTDEDKFTDTVLKEFGTDVGPVLYMGAFLAWFYPEKLASMMNTGANIVIDAATSEEAKRSNTMEAVITDLETVFGPRERTSEEVEGYTHVPFTKI